MLRDSELVRRVQQGHTDAYEQLVRRYERAAKIVALHVVKDHHRAEDVVQESFIIAYQRLNS
ncbi:MAG: RNA polymerase sigma factor [Pirellulaceae bacterium]